MINRGSIERTLRHIKDLLAWTNSNLSRLRGSYPRLNCSVKRNGEIYYYIQVKQNGKTKRQYVGSIKHNKVKLIKKYYYLKEFKRILEHDIKVFKRTLDSFVDYSYGSINDHLSKAYRIQEDMAPEILGGNLSTTPHSSLEKWANEDYPHNECPFTSGTTKSKDGRRFRSKGEFIWNMSLIEANIAFRYEPMLTLFDADGARHVFSPDFQVKCKDGSDILIEHLGMLANEDYAERFKNKVVAYLKCGFVIGDNLILTSDNADSGINEMMIVEAIEKIKHRVNGD